MTTTAIALLGFCLWTLAILLIMEVMRTALVLQKKTEANGFTPNNDGLSPFMQRLARVHANCIENLPVVAAILIYALWAEKTVITDGLAGIFLAARILQSLTHMLSTSNLMVQIRFAFFITQLFIAIYWVIQLLIS